MFFFRICLVEEFVGASLAPPQFLHFGMGGLGFGEKPSLIWLSKHGLNNSKRAVQQPRIWTWHNLTWGFEQFKFGSTVFNFVHKGQVTGVPFRTTNFHHLWQSMVSNHPFWGLKVIVLTQKNMWIFQDQNLTEVGSWWKPFKRDSNWEDLVLKSGI